MILLVMVEAEAEAMEEGVDLKLSKSSRSKLVEYAITAKLL